jgi:hypothetical protein
MVKEYVPAIAAVAAALTTGFCKEDENEFGPVHVYVAPATAPVLKLKDEPAHTGPLLAATGVTGGFTITVVVPAMLVHPLTVAVTEYAPAIAVVALALTDGSSEVEVNVFGPVHEYVAPAIVLAVKFNVAPVQTGPLLPAVGEDGIGFTTTVVVPAILVQPLTVAVTEYVPDIAVVAFVLTDGSSDVDVNEFGPVHE